MRFVSGSKIIRAPHPATASAGVQSATQFPSRSISSPACGVNSTKTVRRGTPSSSTQTSTIARASTMVSHTPQTAPPQNGVRRRRGLAYYMHAHITGCRLMKPTGIGGRLKREEIEMPVAKIHVLEGQYDEARLGRVSSAVQNGLIRALGIPPEDFFQVIHVLPRSRFLHTPSFLGLTYSDDLIVLEVTFISGRPKEKRAGLLNDGAVSAAGISPDDLLITLYETPGDNISFGRGLAQRAHVSHRKSRAGVR